MDDTIRDTLDQTDEDILTYTASDEALEAAAAAAGFERVNPTIYLMSIAVDHIVCC
jgi:uncharacterized phage protein gp47/JayE